jgi:hypothetical protein
VSVTHAIPNASTEAQFNSLFEPRTPNNKKKYDEVFCTLNNLVDNFDNYASEQDEASGDQSWQIFTDSAQNGGEARHLDGAPRDLPLDKIISKYPPYKAPPPPQPITDNEATSTKKKSKAKVASTPRQKKTTIIVTLTEFTHPNGEKSYAASGTPTIRMPTHADISNSIVENTGIMRQPFLDRMRIRQQRWLEYREERGERAVVREREMLLISVKRQRKLKMKKHKYKKLMRKTRNLRRKLGRL